MKKIYSGKIPFNPETGEMLAYTSAEQGVYELGGFHKVFWLDNAVMSLRLKFISFTRGRSSVKVKLESVSDGFVYEMFLKDLGTLINRGVFNNGIIEGDFAFVKRGKNYSLTYAD